jgi:DNA processing protein
MARSLGQFGDDVAYWLRLSLIPGVGPVTRRALLARFGSPEAVLSATPSELREVSGIGPKLARVIAAAEREIDIRPELERCREGRIDIVPLAHGSYPRLLAEIPDPPAVLFVRGSFLAQDALSIAIVGTRHATTYGLQQAERLASSLSRAGLTIVSGLARGIDACAHRAALAAGGRTIAVLANGLLDVYPPEHKELADEVGGQGALISEGPTFCKPLRGTFPRRNRLITGTSLGVIVVEAAERSGALISARHAGEQGRDVFAVPGRVDSRASRGCHQLIRDGAKLVETADDVLEELGPLFEATSDATGRTVRRPAELQLNDQERQVLAAVNSTPTTLDEVAASCGLPVHRVLSTVSVLEMKHLLRRVSGNTVARA